MLMPVKVSPATAYLESLSSENSRRTMRSTLSTIAEILTGSPDIEAVEWRDLTFAHSTVLRAELVKRYAPPTVNKALSAYRRTLQMAWRLGQMTAEAYQKASQVNDMYHKDESVGRYLEKEEIARLFDVCKKDKSVSGARDLAIFQVMRNAGMRRAEIEQLNEIGRAHV